MTVSRRSSLAAALLALCASGAFAYPDKPVEWVVPYPAGGGSDVVARTVAEQMSKSLGQTVIVNNKPGAGTNIGADYVAKAKADGHVMLAADSGTAHAHILSAELRAIGVASPARINTFADIPTLDEQGLKGFEAYAWQGLVVPTGTPAPVVAQLNKALQEALAQTTVKARFQVLGLESLGGTPEQMKAYWQREQAKWGEVIKAANIKLD